MLRMAISGRSFHRAATARIRSSSATMEACTVPGRSQATNMLGGRLAEGQGKVLVPAIVPIEERESMLAVLVTSSSRVMDAGSCPP